MEFPITRERLQKYRINEAISNHTKERVQKEVDQICKDVELIVLRGTNTQYIYKISEEVIYGYTYPLSPGNTLPGSYPGILKELLEKIRYLFPDSRIQMDPLETYILIDWS
jgi:hypothetical protein